MKDAFDSYFSKLNDYAKEVFGTNPTVTYTDSLNKSCLISEPDEDDEVEWKPVPQKAAVSWKEIEDDLGFVMCDELKAYYSTYAFLMLSGKFGNSLLNFYPVDATEPVVETIKREYEDAQMVFKDSQIFLIGNAIVNEDDGYFIYYDNKSNKLFCYESDTQNEVLLSYSIAKTVGVMEARM